MFGRDEKKIKELESLTEGLKKLWHKVEGRYNYYGTDLIESGHKQKLEAVEAKFRAIYRDLDVREERRVLHEKDLEWRIRKLEDENAQLKKWYPPPIRNSVKVPK